MRIIKHITLVLILLVSLINITSAQTWIVPDDQKTVVATMKFTPELQKQGEQVYLKNCQSCHGLPGKDNWARMTPPPGDLAKEKAQANTDGEMFYKITVGKIPMPEFRNIIQEEDRWHVIAYIRSFNPKYVQPEPALKADFSGRVITLGLEYNEGFKKVVITATEKSKEGTVVPAAGVEVQLYVKRYFGEMAVGDIKPTNAQGQVLIEFPADLPGDKEGRVELIAKVNDPKGLMRSTPVKGTYAIGKPTERPGLTETRAWWSTRENAPVWLAVVFTGSVIIVWGFIIYILLSILKIRKLA
jgi:cytochrome c2